MDRGLLVASTFCFLLGFVHSMHALRTRRFQPSRTHFVALLAGFLFQTAFLFQRGEMLGRCPLTNLFEVLIFLCWSVGLLYLVVGPAYRLSLLGTFTSPLIFLIQIGALLAPIDTPSVRASRPDPWLELHAAISIVAYGAFALACVAGVMYLAQERQLKRHQLGSLFHHLPPIADLARVNRRLMLIGFVLLTAGLAAGFVITAPFPRGKLAWGVGIWIFYGAILQAGWWKKVSPRRVAWLSVVAFALSLSTLWGLNFVAGTPGH